VANTWGQLCLLLCCLQSMWSSAAKAGPECEFKKENSSWRKFCLCWIWQYWENIPEAGFWVCCSHLGITWWFAIPRLPNTYGYSDILLCVATAQTHVREDRKNSSSILCTQLSLACSPWKIITQDPTNPLLNLKEAADSVWSLEDRVEDLIEPTLL